MSDIDARAIVFKKILTKLSPIFQKMPLRGTPQNTAGMFSLVVRCDEINTYIPKNSAARHSSKHDGHVQF